MSSYSLRALGPATQHLPPPYTPANLLPIGLLQHRRPTPHQSRPLRRHHQAQDGRHGRGPSHQQGTQRGQERQGKHYDAEGPCYQVQYHADGDRRL
jgi:hypothetical protein